MIQDPSLIFFEDVDGAPLQVGEVVRIVNDSEDGSIGRRFLGQTGVVVGFVYDDPESQFPGDPLVQVRVPGMGEDLFFAAELESVPVSETRVLGDVPESEFLARGPWR
ncbi:Carotenogenesis protein CarS [Hyalangium versicolor]|uniref:Carotenogenesis protein CarS n=1 Tax=Hyalangium versicolor TaxID=2861190 RepID=UPI001CD02AFB|nr:Carotenogenesis protein CarS [Hyalangium versicolor]